MLKENQIRAILQECETALGTALTTLRARLASQHDFEATLWELLVLYGTLPLGKVQYEPAEGTPDILLETPAGMRVWLEATYLYPQDGVQDNDLHAFPQWLRQAIHKAGCPWGQQVHIRLDPARADRALTIPRRNQWPHMCRPPSWPAFVALLTTRQQAVWECPQGNVVVRVVRATSPGASWPVTDVPIHPKHHLVYRAIQHKAEQAYQWRRKGCTYAPLFLMVGTQVLQSRVDAIRGHNVSAEQAIYAALTDTEHWHWATTYNMLGSWPEKRLRVRHSQLIAGIALCQFEARGGLLPSEWATQFNRVCRGTLYMNPHPEEAVPAGCEAIVQGIDLNRVVYGPGWEDWRSDDRGNQGERARRRGGRLMTQWHRDGGFEVEIPTGVLLRLLAGDLSAAEAWRTFGAEQELQAVFKAAFEQDQPLLGTALKTPDPTSRDEARICLRFGPPQPAVINRRRG
jgi:hypothetical protein